MGRYHKEVAGTGARILTRREHMHLIARPQVKGMVFVSIDVSVEEGDDVTSSTDGG